MAHIKATTAFMMAVMTAPVAEAAPAPLRFFGEAERSFDGVTAKPRIVEVACKSTLEGETRTLAMTTPMIDSKNNFGFGFDRNAREDLVRKIRDHHLAQQTCSITLAPADLLIRHESALTRDKDAKKLPVNVTCASIDADTYNATAEVTPFIGNRGNLGFKFAQSSDVVREVYMHTRQGENCMLTFSPVVQLVGYKI
jgi:hypothetical protein